MNHFEEILCEGESLQHHNFHENQQLYDKSTNQSNLISTAVEPIHSPFDTSPKASMFFFSLHSPRQNIDNFQFNNQNSHCRKNSKDYIQPITRRLQFQEQQSLFCEQEEVEEEQLSVKQQEPWVFQSSSTPQKGKKIKKTKNSKGLKNLSVGVYQIVAEKVQTTYKEVANTLIQKLNRKAKEDMNTQAGYQLLRKVEKDEHNIKRRVYDALNVLISAQLLRKEGKKVICNSNLQSQLGNKQYLQKEYQGLNIQVKRQSLKIQQKKLQLQMLRTKHRKLQFLINKNRKNPLRTGNAVNLPFILLKSDLDNIQSISIGKRDVQIQYKGNMLVMGDIDTIEQLQNPMQLMQRQ